MPPVPVLGPTSNTAPEIAVAPLASPDAVAAPAGDDTRTAREVGLRAIDALPPGPERDAAFLSWSAAGSTAYRSRQRAPYDLDADGNIDPEHAEAYQELKLAWQLAEAERVVAHLAQRLDTSQDGIFQVDEIRPVMDAYREAKALRVGPAGGPAYAAAKLRTALAWCDADDDLTLNAVESAVAARIELYVLIGTADRDIPAADLLPRFTN